MPVTPMAISSLLACLSCSMERLVAATRQVDLFKRIDFAEEIEAILVVVQRHRPNGRLFLQINGAGPEASSEHEPHDLVRPAEG